MSGPGDASGAPRASQEPRRTQGGATAGEGASAAPAVPEDAVEASKTGLAGVLDLLRPRTTWGQLVGGVLCLMLGFAVVAQVQTTKRDTTFATARQDELVGILSDLGQRSERLRGDLRDLEETKGKLERDAQGGTALEEARERATTYGLLAGTLPAEGPGIELRIDDTRHGVRAMHLLDALQELRDAGAEVIQINEVRAGVDTYFLDEQDEVQVDGRLLRAPYVLLAIGDPHTMTTALNIPGGVVKTLRGAGAAVSIDPRAKISVSAVRSR
ncbi:DUF881 domain-containing protein [Actinomadura roseirufa]|uniref:DUF881 domain-containing protein n=1 Tax=Actinomadura roseirufa TaxID=2094049 RepID=UPI001041BC2F|nr:DUF881 domain-containing protein [Actinomadura roseirufa]